MSDIAIRVENYILSRVEGCILSGGRQPGVEGLSKLYTIGRAQGRHDTLRDAMSNVGSRMSNVLRHRHSTFHIPHSPSAQDPLAQHRADGRPDRDWHESVDARIYAGVEWACRI